MKHQNIKKHNPRTLLYQGLSFSNGQHRRKRKRKQKKEKKKKPICALRRGEKNRERTKRSPNEK